MALLDYLLPTALMGALLLSVATESGVELKRAVIPDQAPREEARWMTERPQPDKPVPPGLVLASRVAQAEIGLRRASGADLGAARYLLDPYDGSSKDVDANGPGRAIELDFGEWVILDGFTFRRKGSRGEVVLEALMAEGWTQLVLDSAQGGQGFTSFGGDLGPVVKALRVHANDHRAASSKFTHIGFSIQ